MTINQWQALHFTYYRHRYRFEYYTRMFKNTKMGTNIASIQMNSISKKRSFWQTICAFYCGPSSVQKICHSIRIITLWQVDGKGRAKKNESFVICHWDGTHIINSHSWQIPERREKNMQFDTHLFLWWHNFVCLSFSMLHFSHCLFAVIIIQQNGKAKQKWNCTKKIIPFNNSSWVVFVFSVLVPYFASNYKHLFEHRLQRK